MDTLIYVGGAIVFFALIIVSVALHECGHMIPAKLFGVKVTEYFVGFGKRIWSFRRGETEYGLKWLPFGGYCKLVGMYPPAPGSNKVQAASSNPLRAIADASREAEWAEITPADDGRLFYQKATWQKVIILMGGPMMNVLLAFVIFLGVTATLGVYRQQPVVASVQRCFVPADRPEQNCQPGDPDTPAYAAGLAQGDRIVAFNGRPVDGWTTLQTMIRQNLDGPAQLTVQHADGTRADLRPVHTVINGVSDKWDPSKRVQAGFLGMVPEVERQRGGPVVVAQDMWQMTQQSVVALAQFPVKVYNTAADLITGKPRDAYGPMSIVGASRAAGEISSTNQITSTDKLATFFSLLGGVNLFLALFNFVPLLPLDGGHIFGAIVEWLRRVGAKVLRRPDPGYLDTAKMMPLAYAVFLFIALSGMVLIVADLIDPVKLF